MGGESDYQRMDGKDDLRHLRHKSEATIESFYTDAEDLPFEWAAKLICHHIILVALVLGCCAAPSLGFKAFVAGGALVCISVPFLLMICEIKSTNPNKYLLWDKVKEAEKEVKTFDHMRARLGPHRYFVSQDKNGDVRPNVPPPDDKLEAEALTKTKVTTTAMRPWGGVRVTLDKEEDQRLGVTGFQAMLGMSTQLYMLYAAVLLFCLGDSVPAIGAHVALTGGGEAALLDGDESLTYLRTATKYLLCVVLLFYALSISVPSGKSAHVHSKRVKALKRWPESYAMRGKVNDACFGKIDESHMKLYSSCLYRATGVGLPILLEIVVTANYFCANETGCHLPQSPVNMLSTGIFVLVGLLTLFSLHAWAILEFMRLARVSIFRLQILTQELRVAINNFDDNVYHDERARLQKEAAAAKAVVNCKTGAPECQIVKVHAETLVKFLRTWQVTRTFMQRYDISFFFKSISSQVILLITCMVCCVLIVLLHLFAPQHLFDFVLHLFGILVFPEAAGVTLVTVGLVGLWCLCIVYFQACYILQMDTTRLEQLRLLRHLELSLKSTKPLEKDKASRDASMVALDVVSFVRDYVSEHDEPPTLLGVRVDPTFITYLHRSIAVTVAGWAISAITNRFK
jgi:hypothetical protein